MEEENLKPARVALVVEDEVPADLGDRPFLW